MTFQVSHAQGELLAQLVPSVTTPVTLYTTSELRTEVTLLIAVIHPGTGGNIDIDLFHDDDGTTYTNNELLFTIQKADNSDGLVFQAQHPGSGILIKPDGSLGVQVSTANVVTFSVYGITETLAERVRGLGY